MSRLTQVSLLSILILAATTTEARAGTVALVDLEGQASLDGTTLIDHGVRHSGVGEGRRYVVSDVKRAGTRALRFNLQPRTDLKSRVENHIAKWPENQERWIGMSVFAPADMPDPTTFLILSQLYFQNQCSSPSMALGVRQGNVFTIRVARNADCNNTAANYIEYHHPVAKGKWVDFVFHMKPSSAGAGFFEAWVDGKKVVSHKGTTIKKPGQGETRVGIYRGPMNATHVVYFDEIRIGDAGSSFDAVKPRGMGATMPPPDAPPSEPVPDKEPPPQPVGPDAGTEPAGKDDPMQTPSTPEMPPAPAMNPPPDDPANASGGTGGTAVPVTPPLPGASDDEDDTDDGDDGAGQDGSGGHGGGQAMPSGDETDAPAGGCQLSPTGHAPPWFALAIAMIVALSSRRQSAHARQPKRRV